MPGGHIKTISSLLQLYSADSTALIYLHGQSLRNYNIFMNKIVGLFQEKCIHFYSWQQ